MFLIIFFVFKYVTFYSSNSTTFSFAWNVAFFFSSIIFDIDIDIDIYLYMYKKYVCSTLSKRQDDVFVLMKVPPAT